MNRKTTTIFVGILLTLAAFGLITTLINDPLSLIKSLLIGAVVVGVIYFLVKRFSKTHSDPGHQAYRKAARLTKKKNQKRHTTKNKRSKAHAHGLTVISKEHAINKPKQKSNIQLTVIEGKKSRKKNRALF